ncbi:MULTISPECIES: KilA-N domain-containing protein [unclassified Chryseobacterium]|uniref:KilA-N domain-containing protein n=1 Tax=unclassified Chryseobacterium TaxID=2593645 RepID=UPI000D368109|nr:MULTISPECIES: KilA-N domain-containing protein [unclassified Chryseobacterium]PTT73755.1 DNA-binding protein [Chryseobacterium sp. HMWF001]PVV55224.1 KilA-N domain-containing protein [Chryseobacterium sp. HMWF035]
MAKTSKISVSNTEITIIQQNNEDYISLTDMAGYKDNQEARFVVSNWMSTYFTVDFLAVWEHVNNPNFNRMGFHTVRNSEGRLLVTPKRWVEMTNAIGIFSKSGRYGGGIFAHKDIAFEFGTWLSAEFKYFLIREFQRLKSDENDRLQLEWNLQRTLSKINYHIHTDAIKENLIPQEITGQQANFVYANEADLLNVALFGVTAKSWRDHNPDKKGNVRDYATLEQLVVLSNMESINALLIQQGLPQSERLIQLNKVAITQMKSLLANLSIKKLK